MNAKLRELAKEIGHRSYVPFSGAQVGVAAVFLSGDYVPGVRVESAAFPLTISAVVNASSTIQALSLGRPTVLVKSAPFTATECAYVRGLYGDVEKIEPDILQLRTPHAEAIGSEIEPHYAEVSLLDPESLIGAARAISDRALSSVSEFPVGCLLKCTDGSLLPGCNVEHPEWSFILCAERNALGTAVSYQRQPESLYLSCPMDPGGTPCGACRQVLVEQSAQMDIWMDRGAERPTSKTASALLPDHFDGGAITHRDVRESGHR